MVIRAPYAVANHGGRISHMQGKIPTLTLALTLFPQGQMGLADCSSVSVLRMSSSRVPSTPSFLQSTAIDHLIGDCLVFSLCLSAPITNKTKCCHSLTFNSIFFKTGCSELKPSIAPVMCMLQILSLSHYPNPK